MKIKKSIQHKLYQAVEFLETAMAFIIIFVICILIFLMIRNYVITPEAFQGENALENFLKVSLNIIISIEFAKMLVCHSPTNVIEVLLFALSRQIILEHGSTLDTLLGILGIALLFLIRKHLFEATDHNQDAVL